MMKSAQTSKIGKKFQAARESLGLSERDAASRTLINVDFITAIESGDYSIFPARMYALRYFEKYAAFLKIQQQFFDLYDVHNLPEEEEQKSSNAFIWAKKGSNLSRGNALGPSQRALSGCG